MKMRIKNFCNYSMLLAAISMPALLSAAPGANPRTDGVGVNSMVARTASRTVSGARTGDNIDDVNVSVRRSGNTVDRTNNNTASREGTSVTGRSAVRTPTVRPGGVTSRIVTGNENVSRSARSAVRSVVNGSRTGTTASVPTASRSSTSRATAIFTDISKIGGGYSMCRDAYATCMDQFCANANDKYRRCFCSERFMDYRDIESALDEAKVILMRFEDNNLNAVDKTAEEVAAMYKASEGERAIKNDTSGAAEMLEEIGDLLSGKKKSATSESSSTSLGIMNIDITADIGDIWSGGSSDDIWGSSFGAAQDLSALEGVELFNASNKQCVAMMQEACETEAVLNMARSAYNIMISQDCNLYEKSINAKREVVQQTVRTAEKYLREARLEEYRSHNSADVNECIAKVRSALTSDVACGANYQRCLDYSGAYINSQTGEPIYSPRFFELGNLISLDGSGGDMDVLSQNDNFNDFLESRKMFANTALDSCRNIADTVWNEFKRSALIEIAQAQDEKIEQVKMSCVSTMAECYDTQTRALRDFDTTTSQYAGAVSAYAAKAICQEKVTACAALYGNNEGCKFDGSGRLTSDASSCGLTALLAFVDTVDNTRIAEGCLTAVETYLTELCTPTAGNYEYPWRCRSKSLGQINNNSTGSASTVASIADNVVYFALQNCSNPTQTSTSRAATLQRTVRAAALPQTARAGAGGAIGGTNGYYNYSQTNEGASVVATGTLGGAIGGTSLAAAGTFGSLSLQIRTQIEQLLSNLGEELEYQLMSECEALNGYWVNNNTGTPLTLFYNNVFGGTINNATTSYGRCVENSVRIQCLAQNASLDSADQVAIYNAATDECVFTDAWYEQKCNSIGGYYVNSVCYIGND